MVLWHSPFFFISLDVFLIRSDIPLPKYRQKCVFAIFEIGFTAIVHFLAHLRFFCVHQKYRCTNTCENVCSPDLTPILRHLSIFLNHFGGCFASIEGTVAKKRPKTCLLAFYLVLMHSPFFFSTLRFFCVDRFYICQDTGMNLCSPV